MGIQTSSINSGPLAGFKNFFSNPNMTVWQRYGGSSKTSPAVAGLFYYMDRWFHRPQPNVGGTITHTTVLDGSYKWNINYSSATDYSYYGQTIEAINLRPFYGREFTVSWYSTYPVGATPTARAFVFNGSNTAEQIFQTTTPTSLGGNRYSVTFTLTSSDGFIGSSSISQGAQFIIYPNGTATAPPNGDYRIWGLQLELGPVATDVEFRDQATELKICQRYFVNTNRNGGIARIGHSLFNASNSTGVEASWGAVLSFTHEMRERNPIVSTDTGGTTFSLLRRNGGVQNSAATVSFYDVARGLVLITPSSSIDPKAFTSSDVVQLGFTGGATQMWLSADL